VLVIDVTSTYVNNIPGVDTLKKSGGEWGRVKKSMKERKKAHHENSMSILQNRYLGIFSAL
jgi:hypothetical protein